MVKIIRMGLPGETFLFKEEEITQKEYDRLKQFGWLYEPKKQGDNK